MESPHTINRGIGGGKGCIEIIRVKSNPLSHISQARYQYITQYSVIYNGEGEEWGQIYAIYKVQCSPTHMWAGRRGWPDMKCVHN
jgi:hypothetical protein